MGAVIVSALLVSATPANAARLRILQGDVLVNDGAGFARAVDGAEIAPGQQLLSGPQTQSELVYPDGSVVQLPPGVTAIASDMPILTVVELTPSEASLFGPQGVSTTNLVLGVVGAFRRCAQGSVDA